jgi:RNA-directed DNA polymerase
MITMPVVVRAKEGIARVSLSDSNGARRDGRSEVGAAHTTDEAGEFTQGDPVEGRGGLATESLEGTMVETQSSKAISPGLRRIAELARLHPERAYTNLAHIIDIDLLKEAYGRTRKNAASGVDGQTAEAYAENLETNLHSLLDRLHSGAYHAPVVRRVYIPKADGRKTRPIGIPTFEDKVLQRAVVMVLETIYETDFIESSYGFRPGRSPHQALDAIWKEVMAVNGGWVVEADIQSFFDELDHSYLRSFLDRRVKDGVLRRVIHKWLKAGVLEEGAVWYPEAGTPQGGVISPILANVYLHEVLDIWFEHEVKPRLQGRSFLVRFADDFLIIFEIESDAKRVMGVLPKRFARFGLRLHPDKTRVVPFNRPPKPWDNDIQPPRGETFDFLGFTHYWGKSRSGRWIVQRKTAQKRFTRALKAVRDWCRINRHISLAEQHSALCQKLRGHFSYYGITGNSRMLSRFQLEVLRAWHKWLNRRSQRGNLPWERFQRLLERYPLPPPKVVYSIYRLAVNP